VNIKLTIKENIEHKFSERVRLKRAKRQFLTDYFGGPVQHQPFMITRDLTQSECPWLFEEIPKGTFVQGYKCDLGLLGLEGFTVLLHVDEDFHYAMEVPIDALVKL
jgi:hypothetical protein